jgi:hypothetical protein
MSVAGEEEELGPQGANEIRARDPKGRFTARKCPRGRRYRRKAGGIRNGSFGNSRAQ